MGSSMDVLEMAVMLSSLLLPASPLARDHQDLTTRNLNMTFDPREWKLSWECQENATNVACFMIHKEGPFKKKPEAKACHCTFSPLPLSDGVTFEVKMTINQSLFMGRLNYPNSGGEGTAPQNISCFIYDARFMNCTWEKGPAAPGDIQYFLYVRASEKEETECPHYRSDSGTHVACHFDDLQYLTFHNYFLVNGTSQQVGIQFSDLFLSLQEIERISPPANTSVTCNTSHCLIRWEKPRTYHRLSHWDLQYQLDIRQQGSEDGDDPKPICLRGDSENKYIFPNYDPRAKYTLKIRTEDVRRPRWGAWSDPIEFGAEKKDSSPVYIYVLVVLGTVAFALVIGFLFKRFLVMQSLFPPIPRVKDKLSENNQTSQQVTWEELTADSEKSVNEEILTVEEVA